MPCALSLPIGGFLCGPCYSENFARVTLHSVVQGYVMVVVNEFKQSCLLCVQDALTDMDACPRTVPTEGRSDFQAHSVSVDACLAASSV